MVVIGIRGDDAYRRFHRALTFEFHGLYFTPATICALIERQGFEVRALIPTSATVRSTSARAGAAGFKGRSTP